MHSLNSVWLRHKPVAAPTITGYLICSHLIVDLTANRSEHLPIVAFPNAEDKFRPQDITKVVTRSRFRSAHGETFSPHMHRAACCIHYRQGW